METINYKCPDCGANVEFDPATNLLYCAHCGQFFPIEQVRPNKPVEQEQVLQNWHTDDSINVKISLDRQSREEKYEAEKETEYVNVEEYVPDFMEINIYHCSSCGAELMTGDVGISKTCAYCGQSTIVFDRISKEQRPDKILPFGLTKDDAVAAVKNRLAKAKYLPDEIDNLSVDSVYGIYMPYWIYDSHMAMGIKGEIRSNNAVQPFRESGSKDMLVALDASKKFNDDVSILLNPFPAEKAVDFDASYLSGFCADRYDVPFEKRKNDAIRVISKALEDELTDRLPIERNQQMIDTYGDIYSKFGALKMETYGEKYTLKGISYALFPVYFITFRINGKLINILVNGENGKMVGTVPIDKAKVRKSQVIEMIIFGILCGVAGAALFGYFPIIWSAFVFVILAGSMFAAGKIAKEKYTKLERETNSETMFSILRNRE